MTTRHRKNACKGNTYKKGMACEMLARWWLRLKGYRILASRYKTPHGEVDIVACKRRTLVFVEVKARSMLADGLEAITPHARERIGRAALRFVQAHRKMENYDLRFDAVVVRPRRLPYHIVNAWDGS